MALPSAHSGDPINVRRSKPCPSDRHERIDPERAPMRDAGCVSLSSSPASAGLPSSDRRVRAPYASKQRDRAAPTGSTPILGTWLNASTKLALWDRFFRRLWQKYHKSWLPPAYEFDLMPSCRACATRLKNRICRAVVPPVHAPSPSPRTTEKHFFIKALQMTTEIPGGLGARF